MSDLGGGRAGSEPGVFSTITIALIVLIGVLAFGAMLVLGAYAPDMRSGRNGGTHAMSNAATGFSGLYRLAEATGRNPEIARNVKSLTMDELVVLSPPLGSTPVGDHTEIRADKPTLMILPKWQTKADPQRAGWVRYTGLYPRSVPQGVLAPQTRLKITITPSRGAPLLSSEALGPDRLGAPIRFKAPRPLQTMAGTGGVNLLPLITDGAGRIVLAQLGDTQFYILSDPDLLSNRGMRDPDQGRAALALLDVLNGGAKRIVFDVTLNGLGQSPSPLKLAFDPPFLAMTLAIVAVLLLVGLHALGRFGPAERRRRAIAFGKAALVDNSAALVRKAGREGRLGGRYVQVIRERAAIAFGVPGKLRGTAATDAYLDRVTRRTKFTALAANAERAETPLGVLAAARALHDWQGDVG